MSISPLVGIGSNGIGTSGIGGSGTNDAPSFCEIMTFTPTVETNSSGAWSGMQLTVTNNGVGGGNYITVSDQAWTSASGKVSSELTFDSSTDLSDGGVTISLFQNGSPVLLVEYASALGVLRDINTTTIATIAPTIGQFSFGFTLDQAAGTATFSYKLSNAASPTANASLTISGYDNSLETSLAVALGTATSGVNVITINSYQEAFVTNVDGEGYCAYS